MPNHACATYHFSVLICMQLGRSLSFGLSLTGPSFPLLSRVFFGLGSKPSSPQAFETSSLQAIKPSNRPISPSTSRADQSPRGEGRLAVAAPPHTWKEVHLISGTVELELIYTTDTTHVVSTVHSMLGSTVQNKTYCRISAHIGVVY